MHGIVASEGQEEFVEAAPDRDPAGFAVAFAKEEAAEAGEVAEEVAECGDLRPLSQRAKHRQPGLGDDVLSRQVGLGTGQCFELHEADGEHAGQAGHRFQTMSRRVLSLFQSAAGLESLMHFFHQPTPFVVFQNLPGWTYPCLAGAV